MPSPVPSPLRDATSTRRGLMGIAAQTFSGVKTFLDAIKLAIKTTTTLPMGGVELEGGLVYDSTQKEVLVHDGISWKSAGKTVDGTGVSLEGHTHSHVSLTDKPTTLVGYGITDAALSGHVHDDRYFTEAESDAKFQALSEKNQANGYPGLDSTGKILSAQLPAIAITNTYVVNNQASMLALVAEVGDVAVRTDLNQSFILREAPATTLANWQELLASTDSLATSLAASTGSTLVGGAAKSGMSWFQLAAGTIKAQIEELLTHINTARPDIISPTTIAATPGGWFSTLVYAKDNGGWGHVAGFMENDTGVNATIPTTLTTLPVSACPTKEIWIQAVVLNFSNNPVGTATCVITTGGEIKLMGGTVGQAHFLALNFPSYKCA